MINLQGLLEWATAELYRRRLTPIPKQSKAVEQENFRPLSTSSVVVRLLHKTMAKRMKVVVISDLQDGSRKRCSTTHNIAVFKEILRSFNGCKESSYLAFLDFRKAFDSVDYQNLLGLFEDLGAEEKLYSSTQKVYKISTL